VRAVAVNAVAVVVAPFLAACNDPTFAPRAANRPGAARVSAASGPAVRRGGVIPAGYRVTLRDGARAPVERARGLVARFEGTPRGPRSSTLD
jgi:hypothetical protein